MINRLVVTVDGTTRDGEWQPIPPPEFVEGDPRWVDLAVKIVHIDTENRTSQHTVLARTSLEKTFTELDRIITENFTNHGITIDFGFDSSFNDYAVWYLCSNG